MKYKTVEERGRDVKSRPVLELYKGDKTHGKRGI